MVAVAKIEPRAIGKFSLETLELGIIKVDDRYQRAANASMVDFITNHFNQLLCGPLYVGQRDDGGYWIIDGFTRLTALRRKGTTTWPCIIANTTAQQEARLFIDLNEYRRVVNTIDKFKARLFSNDEVAQAIDSMVRAHGFTVGSGPQAITAVRALEVLYNQKRLPEVLHVMQAFWHDEAAVTNLFVLRGLGLLFGQLRYNRSSKNQHSRGRVDVLSMERLIKVFKDHSFAEIHRKAAEMRATLSMTSGVNARCFADAIVYFYNRGIGNDKRLRFTYE